LTGSDDAEAAVRRCDRRVIVTFLIVGLDRQTLAPWHENIQACDVAVALRAAHARAQARGINLVVAAVIGPNSSIVAVPVDERAASSRAA
jgi:hypothetical protein